MSLIIAQSDLFWADLQRQVDWYRDHGGPEIAIGYISAVEATLEDLATTPGMGRSRFRHFFQLARIRSWRVQKLSTAT